MKTKKPADIPMQYYSILVLSWWNVKYSLNITLYLTKCDTCVYPSFEHLIMLIQTTILECFNICVFWIYCNNGRHSELLCMHPVIYIFLLVHVYCNLDIHNKNFKYSKKKFIANTLMNIFLNCHLTYKEKIYHSKEEKVSIVNSLCRLVMTIKSTKITPLRLLS